MSNHSRLFVAVLASVTILLSICPQNVEAKGTLSIHPQEVALGQSVNIYFTQQDGQRHYLEITIHYGADEADKIITHFNGSYTHYWQLEEHFYEGGYFVEVWCDNVTYREDFWAYKTWSDIGRENQENTDRLIASNENLANVIIAAEFGVLGILVLIVIIVIFWAQHKAARKHFKRSWLETMYNYLCRFRVLRHFLYGKADEQVYQFIEARTTFNEALTGSPREWNFDDGAESICSKNKHMMEIIKWEYEKAQAINAYGSHRMGMLKEEAYRRYDDGKRKEDKLVRKGPQPETRK